MDTISTHINKIKAYSNATQLRNDTDELFNVLNFKILSGFFYSKENSKEHITNLINNITREINGLRNTEFEVESAKEAAKTIILCLIMLRRFLNGVQYDLAQLENINNNNYASSIGDLNTFRFDLGEKLDEFSRDLELSDAQGYEARLRFREYLLYVNIRAAELDIFYSCDQSKVLQPLGDIIVFLNHPKVIELAKQTGNIYIRPIVLDKCYYLAQKINRRLKENDRQFATSISDGTNSKIMEYVVNYYVLFDGCTKKHHPDNQLRLQDNAVKTAQNRVDRCKQSNAPVDLMDIHFLNKGYKQKKQIENLKNILKHIPTHESNRSLFNSFSYQSTTNLVQNTILQLELEEKIEKIMPENQTDMAKFVKQKLEEIRNRGNNILDYRCYEHLLNFLMEFVNHIENTLIIQVRALIEIKNLYTEIYEKHFLKAWHWSEENHLKPIYMDYNNCFVYLSYNTNGSWEAAQATDENIANYYTNNEYNNTNFLLFLESSYVLPNNYSTYKLREIETKYDATLSKIMFLVPTIEAKNENKRLSDDLKTNNIKTIETVAIFTAVIALVTGSLASIKAKSSADTIAIIIALGSVLSLFILLIHFIWIDTIQKTKIGYCVYLLLLFVSILILLWMALRLSIPVS